MQTTQTTGAPKVWPGKQGRATTLRRRVTIRALIAELALRDMNHWAVADFLNCSCSTARTYMKELLEAGVVKLPQRGAGKFILDRAPYSLSGAAEAIEQFLDSLTDAESVSTDYSKGFNGLLNGQRVHIPSGDPGFPTRLERPRARRDPLVTALFGRGKAEAGRTGAEPEPAVSE